MRHAHSVCFHTGQLTEKVYADTQLCWHFWIVPNNLIPSAIMVLQQFLSSCSKSRSQSIIKDEILKKCTIFFMTICQIGFALLRVMRKGADQDSIMLILFPDKSDLKKKKYTFALQLIPLLLNYNKMGCQESAGTSCRDQCAPLHPKI